MDSNLIKFLWVFIPILLVISSMFLRAYVKWKKEIKKKRKL